VFCYFIYAVYNIHKVCEQDWRAVLLVVCKVRPKYNFTSEEVGVNLCKTLYYLYRICDELFKGLQ
jgi:hypothetical protein